MSPSTLSRRAFLPFLASPLLLSGCGDSKSPEGTTTPAPSNAGEATAGKPTERTAVELALNWHPEAEHGGFFAAAINDAFGEPIELNVTPGGPGAPVVQNVATGRVPFGIANADNVLTGRAAGADVVAVFAPLQMSPRCILVHEKSGIRKLDELSKAKKLAMNPNSTFAIYLQKRVSLGDCTVVAYPGNVAQFLLDPDFAQQGYVFSEPYVVKKKGGDSVSLMLSDIGFNPYTSCLITSGELIRTKPELVRSVVKASQAGWVKYLADPAAVNARIHELNPEMELDVLEFGVGELKKLCYSEAVSDANFGSMTLERWSQLLEQMVECSALKPGQIKAEEAFDLSFLPKAPSQG